jgi:TonB-dependent receptor
MRSRIYIWGILLSIVSVISVPVSAANSSISGVVKDSKTGEALFGANVILVGTSMGAATDFDGRYTIPNVISGTYTIRASYIGYTGPEQQIIVKAESKIKMDFKLDPVGIEGDTVVVTAQAVGQKSAINQQLTSNQIVNVVSAAKIQELPDANAAESVGRLPGVSVLRNGGEGTHVVIRGMEPKYNSIQIDGVKMSASNSSNRSTDLGMISSNMLDGIQVSKTVTADMDGDVLGGTVNFELHEAKTSTTGRPLMGLSLQGGYNNLSNAYNKYNNYKYIFNVEDRYFDDKLGVFAQVDLERKNLTSNEMGASYNHKGQDYVDYITVGVNLYNIPRDKRRYNGAVVLDYKLPEGKIKLSNFFSSGSTVYQNRAESFYISSNQHLYSLGSYSSEQRIISNTLSLEHEIASFSVDAKLSHSYSETEAPDNWYVSFIQNSAGLNQFSNVASLDPRDVVKAANNNLETTNLMSINTYNSFSKERSVNASLDIKRNLTFSDLVSAEIKFGGKYKYQKRSYDFEEFDNGAGPLYYGGAKYVDDMITSHFGIPVSGTNIPMTYFLDPSYSYGEFLGGDYSMGASLNLAMIGEMVRLIKNNAANIAEVAPGAYGHDNYLSISSDYSGHEDLSAVYLMTTVKIGEEITVIPGIRYQNLSTTYTGPRGVANQSAYLHYDYYDTTVTKSHGYWLPSVSVKYKPLDWFDIRLSYSNTLAYPDFGVMIPRINVSTYSNYITYNNINLKPSQSKNYDVYLSFYNNTIGLFTAGAFMKEIRDLIYYWEKRATGADAQPYYPTELATPDSKTIYTIGSYINNSYLVKNVGIELDWQTHFWYLPEPLSGLVFSANYTHIFSKAQYPYLKVVSTDRVVTYIDTSFTDRLYQQPNNIINLSLGYDYAKFSIRVSMLYQADIFTGASSWPQLRSSTLSYRRWDIAVKQELPWFGIQLFGNINNLNGAKDVSVIKVGGVPTSQQDYGMTADLGIKYSF